MSKRGSGLAATAAGVIAALLATAPASAIRAPVKKMAAKTVVKKPVRKKAKKKAGARRPAPPVRIVYVPTPPIYVPAPPAPPPRLVIPTPPTPVADAALYRYIDDADALLDTVGTSPPDYGFRFDGVDGWAWELSGGEMVLAEPAGDRFRFYAFAFGDLSPFFVSDGEYSYGYDGPNLAAIFGVDGRVIAWTRDDLSASVPIAYQGRRLAERGRAMRASIRRRAPVAASDWADSLGYFNDIELRFGSWRQTPGWSQYRTGPGYRRHRDWRDRLSNENDRRRDRADRFDQWRRDQYRGTPPANAGGWTAPGPGTSGGNSRWQGRLGQSGTRPGGSGQNGWNGRLRPVAPATGEAPAPPAPPRAERPGDGRPGESGAGRPPRVGNPPRPDDIVSPPAPVANDPLPPPIYVAPPRTERPGYDPIGKRAGREGNRPDIVEPDPPASPVAIERPAAPVYVARPTPPPVPEPVYVAPPPPSSVPAPVSVAPPPPPPPSPPSPPPPPPPSAPRDPSVPTSVDE